MPPGIPPPGAGTRRPAPRTASAHAPAHAPAIPNAPAASNQGQRRAGRKQRYTVAMVVQAVRDTKGLLTLTAKRLGCNVKTVDAYAKRYPEVAQAITESRRQLVDVAEAKLHEAVLRGEAWAIAMVLKTLGRERGYAEPKDERPIIPMGVPIIREVIVELPALPEPASDAAGADDDGADVYDQDGTVVIEGQVRVS